MDDHQPPKRLCFHCEKSVPYRTYMNHKRKYYDASNNQWHKDSALQDSSDEDMHVDSPCNSSESSFAGAHICSDEADEFIHNQPFDDGVNYNEDEYLELPQRQIWDNELIPDIEEDFVENSSWNQFLLIQSDNQPKDLKVMSMVSNLLFYSGF